jgi:hypothetical protein
VTVAAAGAYTYDYNFFVSGQIGVLSLTDSGVLIPNTTFLTDPEEGTIADAQQVVGHGVITVSAGDVIGLINTSTLGISGGNLGLNAIFSKNQTVAKVTTQESARVQGTPVA